MSRPYKGKSCIECGGDFGGAGRTGMCSSCSHKLTFSKKEKSFTYGAIHQWLHSTFGRADHCDLCGTENAKKYEWASRNHQYTRELQEWFQVCRKCHYWHDREILGMRIPADYTRDLITILCTNCSEEKEIKKCELGVRNYCDKKCYMEYRQTRMMRGDNGKFIRLLEEGIIKKNE